jgi:GNAT superfamily N-acetyltransferase
MATTEPTVAEASIGDAAAIAALHAESWRHTYRGILPDQFLDDHVYDNRRALWNTRMAAADSSMFVLKATSRVASWQGSETLCGFACVFLDAHPAWGALLDNLHVAPHVKRHGVGARLLAACRERVRRERPRAPLHLFVFEDNAAARRFYERCGGTPTDRVIAEVLPGVRVPEWRYHWNP